MTVRRMSEASAATARQDFWSAAGANPKEQTRQVPAAPWPSQLLIGATQLVLDIERALPATQVTHCEAEACTAQSGMVVPQADPLLVSTFPLEQARQTVADCCETQPGIMEMQSVATDLPVVAVVVPAGHAVQEFDPVTP